MSNALIGLDYTLFSRIGERCDALKFLNIALALRNNPTFQPHKQEVAFIKVSNQTDVTDIFVRVFGRSNKDIFWSFYSTENFRRDREEYLVSISKSKKKRVPRSDRYRYYGSFKVDEMVAVNRRHVYRNSYFIQSHCEDIHVACQYVLESMLMIFRPDEFYIFHNDHMSLTSFLPHRVVEAKQICLYSNFLSKKELNFVKQYLCPKEKFVLESIHSHMAQLPFGFHVTESNLLHLKCKNITVTGALLEDETINRYIKNWLDSKNTRLEYFINEQEHCLTTILKDIDTFSYEEILAKTNKKVLHFERLFRGDSEKSIAIEARYLQRSDGKIATIANTNDSFVFIVWNNKFPEFEKRSDEWISEFPAW